ncbi:hypothetical protein ET495_01010 [Xylanimonas allomyrinae]|uniref:AMIN-like domain-containing protein n=1 Tax=Xylanimonas allomyrinae TaxID=2509459 RepID=A0A4P6EI40_9MICO|nr:hypothetical protein [Xylanimonas allomyrinae]QAY62094.1 hypothetical protein ET495_01010 [Xylanimonas allomyrinae]
MRTRIMTRATAAGLVAAALAVGGCTGSGDDTDPARSAPADASPSPGASRDASPTPPPDAPSATAGTGDVGDVGDEPGPAFAEPATVATGEPSAEARLTVTGVRAATHDGYDRVVFDLAGDGSPGWRVEYVPQALDDGSGQPVDVAGGATLQVRLAGMGFPLDMDAPEYAGDAVTLPGGVVQQVVYRFWFEGYSTAFVGVDEPRPFRVFALENPTRLVVDVAR